MLFNPFARSHAAKPKSRKRRNTPLRRRSLLMESLEDRRMLATVVWDGGGADANWTTPENWASNVAPVANDDLVFPVNALQEANVNDFPAGTSFGSMLVAGSNYLLSGNQVLLGGSVTNDGSGNTFGVDVKLGASGGFANAAGSTFTVASDIDTNGNTLTLNAASGTMVVGGSISGAGSVTTSGSGTTALAGANSYSGITTVTSGTLSVQHDDALGATDGSASTGTVVTGNNASVRLENGVTVTDEHLSSPSGIYFNLLGIGSNATNVWTGDIATGSTLFLRPSFNSILQLDGSLSTNNQIIYVYNGGTASLNGSSSSVAYLYVAQGTTEVNGTFSTNSRPFVNNGQTLSGTGELTWSGTAPAIVRGTLNPGTSGTTGILTMDHVALESTGGLAIQLNGTTVGTQHDQLRVNGDVTLAGNLNVSLGSSFAVVGDTFTIIKNEGPNAIAGAFNGLHEGGLLAVGSDYFQITYQGGLNSKEVVLTKVVAGVWHGGGADANWTTTANWVGGVLPTSGAHLIFPGGASQTTNVNDFAAGTSFGSVLLTGNSYNLSGNPIVLNGSVTSSGTGNAFAVGVTLGASGGFANAVGSTFTVASDIDTNGNTLTLNTASGTMLVGGSISGSGSVSTSGGGITALAGANSYTGITTVTSGTLSVRHDDALGTADGLAATGTVVTGNNAYVRLENGITVADEHLSSPSGIQLNLQGVGSNATNVWTGDIATGSTLFLRPSFNSILQLNGILSTNNQIIYVYDGGTATLNGSSSSVAYLYVGQGTAEVNGTFSTNSRPFVNGGQTLSGTGELTWSHSAPAVVRGILNPGTSATTGILTMGDIALESTGGLSVQLNGTVVGTQYDQLRVNGNITLAGNLNVSLGSSFAAVGDTFTIIRNDGLNAFTGTFNGLGEGGLLAVGSDYFQITYQGGLDSNDVVVTKVVAGVWDGGGPDANWTTAENWVGDVSPTSGAHLIFPSGASQTTNINDFTSDTSFGSVLLTGNGYNLSGNPIVLNGSVTSSGMGNAFGVGVTLGASGGFANAVGSTFTVASDIDTNGNTLTLNAASGTMVVGGSISGAGSVTTSGGGITALAGANSYTGITTVTSGTLSVRHDDALGTADGSASTGTVVTGNNAYIRLENGVAVADEHLSSPPGIYFNLQGIGSNATNIWTGDIATGSTLYLQPFFNSILQLEGILSTNNQIIFVYNGGTAALNGASSSVAYLYVGQGTAEVNGTFSTNSRPFVNSGQTLSGTGELTWLHSAPAVVRGILNPGTSATTGILTMGDIALESTGGLSVQLNGTAAGTQYDQLRVNGDVTLAGNLNVSLGSSFAVVGDTFTILDNVGTNPITGFFNGLPENGLVEYGGNIWSISYVGGTGNDVVLTTLTTNQFPVISIGGSDSAAEALTETDSGLSTAGTLSVNDPDISDTVDVVVSAVAVVGDANGLSNAALLGMFTVGANPVIGSTSTTGTINWSFNSGSEAFNHLAVGESLVLTYTLTATDSQGGPGTQDVVITINGSNDAPVISVATGDSASATLTETDAGLASTGTLSVEDLDTTDTVAVAVSSVSIVGDDNAIGNAALLGMLSVGANPVIDSTSTTGTINWSFDSGSEAFDYLAVNESLVLTYTLTATDSQNATDTQDVVVTINGSNDQPTVDVNDLSVTVDEGTPATNSGTFSDVDLSDNVTITASIGTITSQNSGNSGIWTWAHPALDDLDETVTITAVDGNGGVATASFTLTVNNVAPQLQNLAITPSINENEFATLTGEIVDPGTEDSFTMVVDWGNGTIETFNYPAGTNSFSESYQYLDDGTSGTASHTYAVSIVSFVDDDGGSAGLVQGGNIFLTGHDILSHNNQNGFSVVVLDYLRGTGTPQEIPRTAYDIGVVAVNVDNYSGNLSGGSGVVITPSFLPDPRSGQTFGNFHTFTITSGTSAAQFESFLANIDVLVIPEHGFSNNNAKFNSFAPQLEDFFNAGGDLFVDSSNGQPNYYDFLPSVIGADGPGIAASSGFSATTAGTAIGIQNHMLQYATHNTFFNPDPVFTVFELHNNSHIVSIGAQNVVISDGGLGAALSVTVHNVAPDFDAGPDETLPSPLEGAFSRIIQFADPGSLDVHVVTVDFGDGSGPQTWALSFGDREFSLNHLYAIEGTFTVSVTVEDDDLGSMTDTFDVTVELNTPPIADAGGPYTVPEGSSIQLDASGTFDNEQLNTTLVYEWDLDYDGSTFSVDTTGIQPAVSFPDNFPARTIAVRVTDDGGLTDIATTTLEVTNVAPQLQNVAITPSIDENELATLSGQIVDPGIFDSFTMVVDWGDGAIETFHYPAGTTSFSETHQYLDDGPNPGNGVSSHDYTIGVKLTDDDGGVAENTSAATITVNNVAPIVTSLSSTSPFCGGHNEGQEISIFAAFTDVGTLDTHVASVDWGDGTVTSGTVDQFSGSGTISASHTYNSGGVYTITVTVTDDDGGTATRTTAAMIVGAGVNGGVLYIVGTEGDDHVTVNRQGNGHFRVHANFLPDRGGRLFSTDGIDLIYIILCDGDDHATVAGNITTTVIIDGGPGDDHLKGGGGSNILLGGPGNDTLIGGGARDILIGGTGNDRIIGQAGDDILIGGRTIYDSDHDAQVLANDAALLDILALWNSSDDFGTRQGNLATMLNSSTVEDDEEEDVITGGPGDDWLFAGIDDVITDLAAN